MPRDVLERSVTGKLFFFRTYKNEYFVRLRLTAENGCIMRYTVPYPVFWEMRTPLTTEAQWSKVVTAHGHAQGMSVQLPSLQVASVLWKLRLRYRHAKHAGIFFNRVDTFLLEIVANVPGVAVQVEDIPPQLGSEWPPPQVDPDHESSGSGRFFKPVI